MWPQNTALPLRYKPAIPSAAAREWHKLSQFKSEAKSGMHVAYQCFHFRFETWNFKLFLKSYRPQMCRTRSQKLEKTVESARNDVENGQNECWSVEKSQKINELTNQRKRKNSDWHPAILKFPLLFLCKFIHVEPFNSKYLWSTFFVCYQLARVAQAVTITQTGSDPKTSQACPEINKTGSKFNYITTHKPWLWM